MNWFAYRLPHKSSICTGASEQTIQGIMPGGFAVSPFSQNDFPTFTIPHASDIIDWKPVSSALFPKLSTTPSEHSDELEEILRQIENGIISKCIAATVLIEHGDFDLKSCFNRLCEAYPSAFVFAFSTSITGTWIGASPELLLKYNGGNICTMSLAGTKPLKDTGNWDAKNIHEQKLVTDFITETLTTKGITPKVGELKTMSAGPVKHLCNIIEGNSKSWQHATELALQLSPTPALCGFPRDEAKKLIKETEHFCRSYYGGFCGPTESSDSDDLLDNHSFEFYVNLRSAIVESKKIAIFAGGGIVSGSIPSKEWEETRIKGSTIASILSDKP